MIQSTSSLCDFCRRLDVRSLLLAANAQGRPESGAPDQIFSYENIHAGIPDFLEHRIGLISLRDAAATCDLCSAIWDQFTRNRHPSELTDDALRADLGASTIYVGTEQWVEGLQGLPMIAVFQHGSRGRTRGLAWFEAFADRDHIPFNDAHLLGRSVAASSSSDACLSVASGWLQDCVISHELCQKYNKPNPRLPRRVVEISNQGEGGLMARVIDADDRRGSYVALSYCWGGPGVVMYTRDTEQQLRHGILVQNLPATIRDAMIVTFNLGISYVWVDCLCIQQDDKLDWGREAVRMQGVYRNATVTLRTACAIKVTDTLFPERPLPETFCSLPWANSAKNDQEVVYLRSGLEFAGMNSQKSMLSKRGWTLEEDLLAPRTLTFDTRQISFHCAVGRIDEAGRRTRPTEDYASKAHLQMVYHESKVFKWAASTARWLRIPPVIRIYRPDWRYLQNGRNPGMNDLSAMTYNSYFFQGHFPTPGGVVLTYFDLWRAIIKQYTTRILTQPHDVLTALAGIAEAFHQTHGDIYAAGMWKSDLIRSMAWIRSAGHRRSKDGVFIDLPLPSQRYLAPSWSWAAIAGKDVAFLGSEPSTEDSYLHAVASVRALHLEPAKTSHFGPLARGHIVLHAPFAEIIDPRIQDESEHSFLPTVRQRVLTLLQVQPEAAHEFSQQHRPHPAQRFGILVLCKYRNKDYWWKCNVVLLLESCHDSPSWRRIGCFVFSEASKATRHLDMGMDVNQEQCAELRAARLTKRMVQIV